MAGCRSFLTLLITGALSAGNWAQEPAPNPANPAPPPPPASAREPGPGGPDGPKPGGERRDARWGSKGDGRRGDWHGDKRPRENLTPEQMKERAMRDLEKLTPEQRHEVWRAVWAVLNLPPEKKQELIGMEDDRRKKVREEIERMLANTGIQIPDDQRRKFFHRYFSGRRAIEEQLNKEEEERRQVLMTELEGKMKQEFGSVKADQSQDAPKAGQ